MLGMDSDVSQNLFMTFCILLRLWGGEALPRRGAAHRAALQALVAALAQRPPPPRHRRGGDAAARSQGAPPAEELHKKHIMSVDNDDTNITNYCNIDLCICVYMCMHMCIHMYVCNVM